MCCGCEEFLCCLGPLPPDVHVMQASLGGDRDGEDMQDYLARMNKQLEEMQSHFQVGLSTPSVRDRTAQHAIPQHSHAVSTCHRTHPADDPQNSLQDMMHISHFVLHAECCPSSRELGTCNRALPSAQSQCSRHRISSRTNNSCQCISVSTPQRLQKR